MTALWLNAAMLVLAGGGVLALALASERPGPALLGRKPARRERMGLRLAGWPLLALALVCGIVGWGQGVGWTTWFGWLTVAGAGLVFAFPRWERSRAGSGGGSGAGSGPTARPRRDAPPVPLSAPPKSRNLRAGVMVLLVAAPLGGLIAGAWWPAQPVLRGDAIHGRAGPWDFTIAEYNRRAPKILLGDFPTKGFQIRFCDACDDEIRAAYLKVQKPRSLRGAGIVFGAVRWNRFVEIQLPNSTKPESEIWLTVEGKDGTLHYASWPITRIAPATARWLADRRQQP